MSPRKEAGGTREQILNVAEHLLRTRSFNAFSYQDISEAVGIRKASVHYHFPTKEDLGVALVRRLSDDGRSWAQALAARQATAEEKLNAAFELNHQRTGFEDEKICIYGVLGVEFNTLPPRMQEAVKEMQLSQQRWLRSVLREGQKSGLFRSDEPVESQAAFVSATLQGALQVARTTERPETYKAAISNIRKALAA